MNDNLKNVLVWLLVLGVVLITCGAFLFTTPQFTGLEEIAFTADTSTPATAYQTTVTGVFAGTSVVKTTPKTTVIKAQTTAKTSVSVDFPLNINTATVQELMCVSGIGETYAKRIVAYRDEYGPFTELEQLLDVEGIGEKRLASWRIYLTVA